MKFVVCTFLKRFASHMSLHDKQFEQLPRDPVNIAMPEFLNCVSYIFIEAMTEDFINQKHLPLTYGSFVILPRFLPAVRPGH